MNHSLASGHLQDTRPEQTVGCMGGKHIGLTGEHYYTWERGKVVRRANLMRLLWTRSKRIKVQFTVTTESALYQPVNLGYLASL